jgi:alkanesulfonate monooxygenase SsuD/methylene tetrahydromethanopterin reductase-like flavin-dependent oxidoreductase (luciferase family)
VIRLWKELWTHPAPEKVTFEGKYVQVKKLPFNPEPYQRPHMPIWWGGDSEASMEIVKRYSDGWMSAGGASLAKIKSLVTAPDWPGRPMVISRSVRIFVNETREGAIEEARQDYEGWRAEAASPTAITRGIPPATFEDFLQRQIIGGPDECLDQLTQIASVGVNYFRTNFPDEAAQEKVARLIVPRLDEIEERLPAAAR